MAIIKDTYTQKEFKRNKLILLIIKGIIGVTYLWITYAFVLMIQQTSFSIIGIIIASVVCFIAFRVIQSLEKQNRKDMKRNNNTWGKGSEAESVISKSLNELPHDFKVIEDFDTGRGNIDFIVIGPTGIFTIEVKASSGRISYYGGQLRINNRIPEKNYLTQIEAERFWLFGKLKGHFDKSFPVIGLLEFPYGSIDKSSIYGSIKDNIWIGEGTFHNYLINNAKNSLSLEEIMNIYIFLTSEKSNSSLN